MKYLAVLGREPDLSNAELEAVFGKIRPLSSNLSLFESDFTPDIKRLGGTLKIAEKLSEKPLDFLLKMPEGKITLGVSDYSKNASKKSAAQEAMKLKKILVRLKRSVRVVPSDSSVLSSATSLHNGLSGKNLKKCELIKFEQNWFRVIGVQDIDAYTKRDQGRPKRDAKVGMLPPKLAQILINLCGPLPKGATILDPFCGTGVLLQEALLMGYRAYGTDLSNRMIEFSEKNLDYFKFKNYKLETGNAMNHQWPTEISAVACETYLGKPMSKIPSSLELNQQKQECTDIILGFLKNLSSQIKPNTPVTIAIPAWLRPDGKYERLEILDQIQDMGYNVNNKSRGGLLYFRDGQIVSRDIIILRKN